MESKERGSVRELHLRRKEEVRSIGGERNVKKNKWRFEERLNEGAREED